MEKYTGKRIEISGSVVGPGVRDDGITEDTYLGMKDHKGPLAVRFANPYIPGGFKAGQHITFSGRVQTRKVRGILDGYFLLDCRLVK